MTNCAWCGESITKGLKTPTEGEVVCDKETCATEYANSRGIEPLTKKLKEKAKKSTEKVTPIIAPSTSADENDTKKETPEVDGQEEESKEND